MLLFWVYKPLTRPKRCASACFFQIFPRFLRTFYGGNVPEDKIFGVIAIHRGNITDHEGEQKKHFSSYYQLNHGLNSIRNEAMYHRRAHHRVVVFIWLLCFSCYVVRHQPRIRRRFLRRQPLLVFLLPGPSTLLHSWRDRLYDSFTFSPLLSLMIRAIVGSHRCTLRFRLMHAVYVVVSREPFKRNQN